MASFPWSPFLVLLAWASVAAAGEELEIWHMRHTERGCTRTFCFYRFLLQEAQHTGEDGIYCEVTVSPQEVEHFSSERFKEWTTTNNPLETYRIDAERNLNTNAFIITVTNLERLLYTAFGFSEDQWEAMQVPQNSINYRPGPQDWTQDSSGVAVSMFLGAMIQGRSEKAAAKNRTTTEEPAPEAEKRTAPEIWHLNELYHYVEIDSRHSRRDIRKFKIQEANTKAPGPEYRVSTSTGNGLSWDWGPCNNDVNNEALWSYLTKGYYNSDGTIFTIMVENIDRQLLALFQIDAKAWEGTLYPDDTQPIAGVAFASMLRYIEAISTKKRTIGEEPADTDEDKVRARRRTGVAPDALPRVRRKASAESRPLEFPYNHKRAINHPRSGQEQHNLVDAPQWTIDGLTRDFTYDETSSMWRVDFNFKLISTDLDGTVDTRPEAAATCHSITYLVPDRNHRTESVWLQKCDDIDFFMSWGYIENEDSAVMTVLYINPDKGGKSRIGWIAFQGVNDRTSFDTTAPFPTEEHVCSSDDAWPCNTQA